MHRLRSHLTYANVAATLALMIAIAGGATAVAGSSAPSNSVASRSIKPFNVTARDLAGIQVVQASDLFAAFARCPKAARIIGGGASSSGNLGASRPAGNGWSVSQGVSTSGNVPVTAYAICLKAKPGK